jgi:hypothetical protein
MLLRFLTIFAIAVWFGGFTFYSTAVIATAQEVLHSHLRAGLITQQVTGWLNLISLPALAVCCGNLIAQRKSARKVWLWLLGGSFGAMVLLQAALFAVHPMLDKLIVNREVEDAGAFFRLHRVYLVLSTGQWLATLGYVWSTLSLWRAADG